MKGLFTGLILLLLPGLVSAADQAFEKRSREMLQHFVDGEVEEGIKIFSDDPLIRKNVSLVRIDEIVQGHAAWLKEIGPIVSYSRFFLKCYSDRLCGEIYVANTEKRPVVYRYTWFKPQDAWLLEGLSFTANIGPTLLEPEESLWGSYPPDSGTSRPSNAP